MLADALNERERMEVGRRSAPGSFLAPLPSDKDPFRQVISRPAKEVSDYSKLLSGQSATCRSLHVQPQLEQRTLASDAHSAGLKVFELSVSKFHARKSTRHHRIILRLE